MQEIQFATWGSKTEMAIIKPIIDDYNKNLSEWKAKGGTAIKAINAASDLMAGRRVKFILRLVSLIIVLAIMWVIVMLPLILFDLWMKTFEWTAGIPFIPICLNVLTCFTAIYTTTYLYLYYRWMLYYED